MIPYELQLLQSLNNQKKNVYSVQNGWGIKDG